MIIMNTLRDFTSIGNHVQREKGASTWPCSAGLSPLSSPPLQAKAFSSLQNAPSKSSHLCRKPYNSYFTKFKRDLCNHHHQSGCGTAHMESVRRAKQFVYPRLNPQYLKTYTAKSSSWLAQGMALSHPERALLHTANACPELTGRGIWGVVLACILIFWSVWEKTICDPSTENSLKSPF